MGEHANGIHAERRGSGAPLLLLHGLGGEWGAWLPVLPALAAERDVIAVDLPGFGRSPCLPEGVPPTPAALAGAVAGALEALGVERPDVAGNSLGGWVALELAALGAAGSVTAIAPAGLWPQPLRPKPALTAHAIISSVPGLVGLLSTRPGRRLALAATVAHPERMTDEEASRMLRAYAEAPGFEAANAEMRSGRFTAAGRVRVPVTVAWCERDRLVGRVALPFPARELVLRDCGHIPMTDDPDAVAAVTLAGARRRPGEKRLRGQPSVVD